MHQVLIIEDDKDIAELTSIHLQDVACEVEHCVDGESGYAMATQGQGNNHADFNAHRQIRRNRQSSRA